MKTIIKALLLSTITTISYSQTKTESKSGTEGVNKIDLSEVVVKNTGKESSIYVRDLNVDPKVLKLEQEFINYDLGKNAVGYDAFYVKFELEKGKGKLEATYNENGKLTSVNEKYRKVELPISISRSIYKEYPGWQIVDNTYTYSQENGTKIKKEYSLTMTKDNKTQKIKINPAAEIVAVR